MTLIIDQFPCRSDNFGVLIHDTESGLTAAIDAPEFDPIKHRLAERGWKLDQILVTHHHLDHVEGILPLKQAYGCTVIGPAGEADKIPGLDRTVKEGDVLSFGAYEIRVLDTPGHTLGHISYYIPAAKAAFADALEQAETKLLRSASVGEHHVRIAAALNSNKVLLRSALLLLRFII